MDELFVGVNLFLVCLALALVEVHIEGPHGWAAKLPTWRIDKPWIRRLTNGKPITGYHVYINLVILAFLHYPVIVSKWTLAGELRVLSQYMLIAVWWDFLWFVTNPYFGLRRFKSANIWWHKKWVLGMPADYPTGMIVSAALWFGADMLQRAPRTTMGEWATLVGVIVGLTLLTAAAASRLPRRAADEVAEETVDSDR
ncbi:MAG: hypothetical protein IT464_01715 [Planctomycetes bacterium]|nr:hypothetical protein [Planctomycetota bacterium]